MPPAPGSGEFAAISALLAKRKIPWAPPTDLGQHYSDDMREYLAKARAAFKGSEVVLKGLKAYESEVSELLGGVERPRGAVALLARSTASPSARTARRWPPPTATGWCVCGTRRRKR